MTRFPEFPTARRIGLITDMVTMPTRMPERYAGPTLVPGTLAGRGWAGLDALADRPAALYQGLQDVDALLARSQLALPPLRPHRAQRERVCVDRRDRLRPDGHLLGLTLAS